MPFVCATHFLSNEIIETIVIHFSFLFWSDKVYTWNIFEMLIPENTLNLDLASALRNRMTPNSGKGDAKVQRPKLGMNQRYWVFAQDETKPNQTKASSLTRLLNSTEIQIYAYLEKREATGSALLLLWKPSCLLTLVQSCEVGRVLQSLEVGRGQVSEWEGTLGPWWRHLPSTGEAYYLRPKKASSR